MILSLDRILDELNAHKRDRAQLYQQYIEERLIESMWAYYDDLSMCVSHLYSKYGTDKIIRELSR